MVVLYETGTVDCLGSTMEPNWVRHLAADGAADGHAVGVEEGTTAGCRARALGWLDGKRHRRGNWKKPSEVPTDGAADGRAVGNREPCRMTEGTTRHPCPATSALCAGVEQ
jgi:hypothetical protein